MADLSLKKLRPLIANENCFHRRDVARAIMQLWITRDEKDANVLASDLIIASRRSGEIQTIPDHRNPARGPVLSYMFVRTQYTPEVEAMFELLLDTQKKLAEAERQLSLIACA